MSKAEKRRGLGRGLSALMSDVAMDDASTPRTVTEGAQVLPIELITPNPDQPRKTFSPDQMDELVASISEKGIIQPLIVRQMDDNAYQLVAGERRWRAAQRANLHEVPVVIREFTDLEVVEIAIIENVQRADLNPIEEAAGYRQLMDKFGHTQEKLAQALGKSRSHIANLLRLLQLPDSVVAMVQEGVLSAGHARALVTCDDAEGLAKQIVARGLSVRETEALVKKQSNQEPSKVSQRKPRKDSSEKDADTKALEGDLSAALGMQVSLDHKEGTEAGSLTIRYETLEQLDELCQALASS